MKNIDIKELRNTEVFKVPDNYFDNLTDTIMSKIPAEETKVISINQGRKWKSAWWKWSSAACIAILAIGTTFLAKTMNSTVSETPDIAASYDEKSQEEMSDYMMLDTEDVYCYLSGEFQ